MHEYGIARDIVRQAVDEAERWGAARITALHIRVGAAEFIDREALSLGVRTAVAGTVAEGAAVEIRKAIGNGVVLKSMEVEEAG